MPRVEAAAFVLTLRARGVSDLAVLRAMETVPRELFAPRRYLDLARQDVALPLPCGETMTAPAVVARMLGALEVQEGARVLEVGTGSGYVGALFARMGGRVLSFERHRTLAESAARRWLAAGIGPACEVLQGDGLRFERGEGERFDRILLNGSVSSISTALTSRLAAGGRLVFGHRGPEGTRLVALERGSDGRLASHVGPPLRLTPLADPQDASASAPETEA